MDFCCAKENGSRFSMHSICSVDCLLGLVLKVALIDIVILLRTRLKVN